MKTLKGQFGQTSISSNGKQSFSAPQDEKQISDDDSVEYATTIVKKAGDFLRHFPHHG